VTGGSASGRGLNGTSAASRAANLEQKLEDLVAILKAQAGSVPAPAPSQSNGGEPHLQQGTLHENIKAQLGVPTPSVTDQDMMNGVASRIISGGPPVVTPAASIDYATCSTAASTPRPLPAPVLDDPISAAQAEETLAFFRQHYLQVFPFVHIPSDMKYVHLIPRLVLAGSILESFYRDNIRNSAAWLMLFLRAAQIQRDRPYLWLNISAVCSRSPIKQAALNRRSREELANKILVSCERNIDMLLGTLCNLGWYVRSVSTYHDN
jgi:hypothetical protein